jgi:hypothetical protein
MVNDQKKTTWYTEYCVQEIKKKREEKKNLLRSRAFCGTPLWSAPTIHLTATESPLIAQIALVPPSLFRSRGPLLPNGVRMVRRVARLHRTTLSSMVWHGAWGGGIDQPALTSMAPA